MRDDDPHDPSVAMTAYLASLIQGAAPPGTRWLLVCAAPGTERFASRGSTVADIMQFGIQIGQACEAAALRRRLN